MTEQGFDVAVVGAGMGGLVTACLMARTGRSVILLEQASRIGGVCQPIECNGYRFEVGATLLTGFDPVGPLTMLCERLDIRIPFQRADPAFQVALPRHRLSLWAEPDAWWREVRREFPDEEQGWRGLWSELEDLATARDRVRRELPSLPPEGWRERVRLWRAFSRNFGAGSPPLRQACRRLKPALATSFRETLARHGLGQTSQRVLEAALWYLGVRDAGECSTLEAAVAIDGVRRGAVCIPVGTAALLDALAERYQRDQGQLRLNTPVARFLVEGGRIGGLVTGDGELIRTRWVVANLSPDILSGGLLPPWHGRFKRRSSLEVSWRPTHSLQALLLTISARYVPSELSGHCFVVRDPSRTARDANVVFVRTSPAERHMQGSDAIRCITAGRFAPLAAHDDEASVRAALLEALDQVIPGVADGGGDHRTLLPAELAARWGRPSAAVRYAGEYRDWLGQRGLPHQFEWPGLLVVGEWTYPGRMIANVVEGAMRVSELISQSP